MADLKVHFGFDAFVPIKGIDGKCCLDLQVH